MDKLPGTNLKAAFWKACVVVAYVPQKNVTYDLRRDPMLAFESVILPLAYHAKEQRLEFVGVDSYGFIYEVEPMNLPGGVDPWFEEAT